MKLTRLFMTVAIMASAVIATAQNTQPNIIVFIVDDMGWMDTSLPLGDSVYPLNKRYHTPNMERLAREGMKFSNAYATPVCTPSRASLMSGMNAARHRITNWTSPYRDKPTDAPDIEFNRADWNYNGFSGVQQTDHAASATPLPLLLKNAGYFTAHVGKAHWGPAGTPGANPYNMGFMVNIAGHAGGHPQSYLGTENYGNLPGKTTPQAVPDLEEYHATDTFLTEALTREAIKTLEDPIRHHRPFFLYMSHYAVHVPIQADKRFVQKYIDAGLPPLEAGYASLLEGMDKSLGDIMDFLRRKQIDQQTIVLFVTDNGGLSTAGNRAGTPHTQNLPLRAGKGSVYEGGIRVPLIVKWSHEVKPGSRSDQPVIIEDLYPTVLEMAGIKKYDHIQQVDGRSFVPVLKQQVVTAADRPLYWHYPNKWINDDGPGINYYSAMRLGDWKLVYGMRKKKLELYNLRNDIGEQKDLSQQFPEKTKELAGRLTDYLKSLDAPMPAYVNGQRVPWPAELGSSKRPAPTAAQLKWQKAALGFIFHYDLHVFDSSQYKQADNRNRPVADYNIFNPEQLDVEQWVLTAKSAGAKFALITATHETGFALYPSDVNPYNVRLLRWQNGKADLLDDFVKACRKHGIEPGVYVGIRWNSFYGVRDFNVDGEPGSPMQKARQAHYNRMVEGMVTEICTRYGPLFEIWFDGGAGNPNKGAPDVLPIVKKYQPQALFYHNEQLAEARWGGSESGTVSYPCWSTFPYPYTGSGESAIAGIAANQYALLREGDAAGSYWVPAMADAPLRGYGGRHEWFWEPGDENHLYPVNELMDIYYKSIGRNATLIIGLTPDNRGLIPEQDVTRIKEWGEEIRKEFGEPVRQTRSRASSLELTIPVNRSVKHIVLEENIESGHTVREFELKALVNGKWQPLFHGTAIGNKFILPIKEPVSLTKIKFSVLKTMGEQAEITLTAF